MARPSPRKPGSILMALWMSATSGHGRRMTGRRGVASALCILRWGAEGNAAELLRRDLAFVLRHARQPCFDIWEEERGLHAYTLRVSAAALAEGADWLDRRGERTTAEPCRTEAGLLETALDEFWMVEQKHLRSRFVEGGAPEGAARHVGDPGRQPCAGAR